SNAAVNSSLPKLKASSNRKQPSSNCSLSGGKLHEQGNAATAPDGLVGVLLSSEVCMSLPTVTTPVTITVPTTIFQQLEILAHQQHRSVSDMVCEIVLREVPLLPALPQDVEAELAACTNLSDEVLWLLARNTLTEAEQEELATLNDVAQQHSLTQAEQARQQVLV